MTNEQLQLLSKKDLADKARKLGVPNFASLKKDDLVQAILRAEKKKEKQKAKEQAKPAAKVVLNGKHSTKPEAKPVPVVATKSATTVKPIPNGPIKTQKAAARDTTETLTGEEQIHRSKYEMGVPTRDLSSKMPKTLPNGYGKDRIIVMVRDPYWLHVYWELTHQAVQRAEAALGQDWHGSKPILRVCDVSSQDTTSIAESIVKDIEIHGGCSSWYVEVQQPPKSYRIDIGYISKRGTFFPLCRSNIVTTPKAGVSDTVDESWMDMDEKQAERIYAMSSGFDPASGGSSLELKQFFEERFRRPMGSMGSGSVSSFSSALPTGKGRKFFFELNAELIVYGRTEPGAKVTLQGEPVTLRSDGTFTMRYGFPDGRQIIPAVAASADGIEERTIVLAVERNTKQLEPMIHDQMNDTN